MEVLDNFLQKHTNDKMQVKEGNTTITFSMDWIQPLMRS
jgi:hypothetical protein